MSEIWVARDADGDLWWFDSSPEWDERTQTWYSDSAEWADTMPNSMFPDLQPGECRRLVMAEKEKGE